jgi:hypothetical protein
MMRLWFSKGVPGASNSLCRASPLLFRRAPLSTFFRRGTSTPKIQVNDVLYDKTSSKWGGKFFGVPVDTIVYNSKLIGGGLLVCFTLYMFVKGYVWLAEFSLVTVARLGFLGGFVTSAVLYTTALSIRRRAGINPNAVYNQSIALAMRNSQVSEYLGPHPRTGDFKAYCASGGFKLPLARRLRSGSYELSDALGTKPRRLQMMFILRNPVNGREGLVTVDVQKETTGFLSSTDTYKSLAVTLSDTANTGDPKTVVIIGRPEDVVYRGLMKL